MHNNLFHQKRYERNFRMNSGILYEDLEDGSVITHLLDRENGDFDFVYSFVESRFTQTGE